MKLYPIRLNDRHIYLRLSDQSYQDAYLRTMLSIISQYIAARIRQLEAAMEEARACSRLPVANCFRTPPRLTPPRLTHEWVTVPSVTLC